MRVLASALVALFVIALPATSRGWGMDVHRYLTGRALDGLPADLKPFFAERRAFIVEHAADPDLWRVVGLKGDLGDENPNHQLDIDALDEPAPFTNVPRDLQAFIARYGADRANKTGRLPWRTEEIYGKLVTAFHDIGAGTAPYAADNARYLAAILAHYIEDAHVPFHAVQNYDGQLTNQRGIHSRFETDLVARNMSRLALTPVAITPIGPVRDFIFDTLVTSQSLVAGVLDADTKAAEGRDFYDDQYFAKFWDGAHATLERRMSDASSAVASAIVQAWQEGGKPKLPLDAARGPARIRR